jgi:hypothetical protein
MARMKKSPSATTRRRSHTPSLCSSFKALSRGPGVCAREKFERTIVPAHIRWSGMLQVVCPGHSRVQSHQARGAAFEFFNTPLRSVARRLLRVSIRGSSSKRCTALTGEMLASRDKENADMAAVFSEVEDKVLVAPSTSLLSIHGGKPKLRMATATFVPRGLDSAPAAASEPAVRQQPPLLGAQTAAPARQQAHGDAI